MTMTSNEIPELQLGRARQCPLCGSLTPLEAAGDHLVWCMAPETWPEFDPAFQCDIRLSGMAYQEFKEAFLALDLPDDDEQRAYHNIALIKTQIKMNRNGSTPNSNIAFREVMKQEYNQLYSAGQTPYYTIFDPMRWAKFFDALKQGDFKQDD